MFNKTKGINKCRSPCPVFGKLHTTISCVFLFRLGLPPKISGCSFWFPFKPTKQILPTDQQEHAQLANTPMLLLVSLSKPRTAAQNGTNPQNDRRAAARSAGAGSPPRSGTKAAARASPKRRGGVVPVKGKHVGGEKTKKHSLRGSSKKTQPYVVWKPSEKLDGTAKCSIPN